MNQPIKRKNRISEMIVCQIEASIKQGELKPGKKLPSIQKLSGIFEVSQSSVREALVILEKANLIEMLSGKGTFVK